MTYSDILASLLAAAKAPGEIPEEKRFVWENQIASIRDAHARGDWLGVGARSGELVEALLALRLESLTPKPNLSRARGMDDLMQIAQQRNILPDGSANRASDSAISTVRIIRNSGVHLRFTSRQPTALRAAQAVALLLCASEALFPSRAASGSDSQVQGIGTDQASELLRGARLGGLTDEVREQLPDTFLRAARGTITGLVHLTRYARNARVDVAQYGAVVAAEFAHLVRRAATTNSRVLLNFTKTLRNLGLPLHSRVFAALLPVDIAFLSNLLGTRAPVQARSYVVLAHATDSYLFRGRMSRGGLRKSDIEAMWRRAGAGVAAITNIVDIASWLPRSQATAMIIAAPKKTLYNWMLAAPIWRSLRVLSLLREDRVAANPRLSPLKREVMSALPLAIKNMPLVGVSGIINIVRRFRLVKDSAGVAVIEMCLQRAAREAVTEETLPFLRRIAWDAYTFCERKEAEALALARKLIAALDGRLSWEAFCLAGMLEVNETGSGASLFPAPADVQALVGPSGPTDRWQKYLAVVGASALNPRVQIHPELSDAITAEAPREMAPYPRSLAAYSRAFAAVGGESPV